MAVSVARNCDGFFRTLRQLRKYDLSREDLLHDKAMNIVCYIPMLEGQTPDVRLWLETVRARYGVVPVLLPQADWNNDLTPWPAEAIFKKGKSFGGNAEDYLHRLAKEIIPDLEAEMNRVPDERWLLGISLAGLFAVWAAARSDLFTRIAAVSGSFWYPGFTQWLHEQTLSTSLKAACLTLGRKEAEGRNPHLRDIAVQTRQVADCLTEKGVPTDFIWTEGTHFAPVVPRLEQAIKSLSAPTGTERLK